MRTLQYAKAHTAAFKVGRRVEDTARVVVRPATPDAGGPTGTFQDETGALPW